MEVQPMTKKLELSLQKQLLRKQEFLVTQANDLAKAFGNLSNQEHRLLDYMMAEVQPHDAIDTTYHITILELRKFFGLTDGGKTYENLIKSMKNLNEKTALYIPHKRKDGTQAVIMTSLFSYIDFGADGNIYYKFGEMVAPFVFKLKKNFYSFRLLELSQIKSKYALILLKLWNANAMGQWRDYTKPNQLPPNLKLEASLADWETWLLGYDKDGNPRRWVAGQFKARALMRGVNELQRIFPYGFFRLTTLLNGRVVTGFRLEIKMLNSNLPMDAGILQEKEQVQLNYE